MAKKSEASPSRPGRSTSREKEPRPVTAICKPSYPLSEIAATWECDARQLMDYIALGMLECCVLIQDRDVQIRKRGSSGEEPNYRVEKLTGHYRLIPQDAVNAYAGYPNVDPGELEVLEQNGQRIVAKEPDGTGYVSYWLARKDDLRITHEERERFAREHGIVGTETPTDSEEESRPLRRSKIDRERCRAIAKVIWEREQDTTIADMINRREIIEHGCYGHRYSEGTLRNWIKDLAPNRAPGRRPSAQK
jgi:hypothetical protein